MNKEQLISKYGGEQVLCVPNEKLSEDYGTDDKVTKLLLAIAKYGYYDFRYNAELDFDARQVIPYVVLQNGDKYFVTERIQGDERLVGKMSIAVGGHVNPCDTADESGNPIELNSEDGAVDSIVHCIMRELDEETTLNLSAGFSVQYHTTFVDDRDEVSKVHVCLLTFVKLNDSNVAIKETEKLKGQWMTLDEIEQNRDKFEGWSTCVLDIIKEM